MFNKIQLYVFHNNENIEVLNKFERLFKYNKNYFLILKTTTTTTTTTTPL